MFRTELSEKLSAIFDFPKTTYNVPSDSHEQDTLFVEVNECNAVRITDGMAYAKVLGTLTVFSQIEKVPFGFFSKKIQQADPSLTKDFFFFDIDVNPANSPARIQNILERHVRFVYLYSGQYDPQQGSITSLEGI